MKIWCIIAFISFVGRFEITSIISMQELQAINEKVKELEWNE